MQKILYIENDPELTGEIHKRLVADGFEFSSTSYDTALEAAKIFQPALIILPVVLPNYSGLGTIQALRKDIHTSKIPIMALTNLGQEEIIKSATQPGTTSMTMKLDTSIEELSEAVKSFFKTHGSDIQYPQTN